MRKNNRKLRQIQHEHGQDGGSHQGAIHGDRLDPVATKRRDPLALPTFSSDALKALAGDQADWAALALTLLDEVGSADISADLPPSAIAVELVKRFVMQEGELRRLSPLHVELAFDREHLPEFLDLETGGLNTDLHVWVAFDHVHGMKTLPVGRGLEFLERQQKGLGQTVLSIIDSASAQSFNVMTFNQAHYLATYIYWYGSDSDEDFLDEHCAMYGEEANVTEDVFKPSDFTSNYPVPWAYCASRHINRNALARLARMHQGRETGALLADVAALASKLADKRNSTGLDDCKSEQSIYPSALLSWGADDNQTTQIFDDYVHEANSTGGEGYSELELVAVVEEQGADPQWVRHLRYRTELYYALDRLLDELVILGDKHADQSE